MIVREIVAAMKGTVRVESALGRGATFIVELPRGGVWQTPEDLYLLWPGGLSKLDKLEGQRAFTETLPALRRHATFGGQQYLWLGNGPNLERYLAR